MQAVDSICETLGEVRYHVDDRHDYSPGWRFNEWELKGVPLRIEIGPRDLAKQQVVLARRDIPGREGKAFTPIANVAETVKDMLDTLQADMLKRATEFRDMNTFEPTTYDSFKEVVEEGFARAWWCENAECEEQLKAETQATIRCIPIEQPDGDGVCIVCGETAKISQSLPVPIRFFNNWVSAPIFPHEVFTLQSRGGYRFKIGFLLIVACSLLIAVA